MATLNLRFPVIPLVIGRVKRPWQRYMRQRLLDQQREVGLRLLRSLSAEGVLPVIGPRCHISSMVLTRSDVAIIVGCDAQAPPKIVLKLPLTAAAVDSTNCHRDVLIRLHSHHQLGEIKHLLPRPVIWNTFEEQYYYIESAIPGVNATQMLSDPLQGGRLLKFAADAILQLHLATSDRRYIDSALFAALVEDDLQVLQYFAVRWPSSNLFQHKLKQLRATLEQELAGRILPLTWVHGDFWPGNLLADPATGQLNGIIDWDRSLTRELPVLDLFHLLAYTRKLHRRTEAGDEIVNHLLPLAFSPEEHELLETMIEALDLPRDRRFMQAAVLLYWLRFAAANLRRYPSFGVDRKWLDKNAFLVLKRGI